MKRVLAFVIAVLMAVSLCAPVSAQSALLYVTDFDYAVIRNGGTDGAFVYSAYEDNGNTYKMGLLTEDGEQSRVAWEAEGWNALFAASEWSVTMHGTAEALCPYVASHTANTLCPSLDVALVTLTNHRLGVTIEQRYMKYPQKHITSGGSVHVCLSNYKYTSPETLKWDGVNTRVALADEQGRWGVLDLESGEMLVPFSYSGMSAVYGDYVKVSDGTAWGRLDLSGATATVMAYARETAFSITEELREITSGQWRVFNADNEPISAVFAGTSVTLSYAPQAHAVLSTPTGGTASLLDLTGETIATFTSTQQVSYLDRACYAVTQYNATGAVIGVALTTVQAPTPADTVLAGDLNFDDTVDTADARLLLKAMTELRAMTARQQLAADLNADGKQNSSDVRAIMMLTVQD